MTVEGTGGSQTVLVHRDARAPFELLGVWCPPAGDSPPLAFYPHDGDAQAYGRTAVIGELGLHSWREFAERLAMRTPHSAWWEAVEIPGHLSPSGAFDEVRSALNLTWTAEQLADRALLPQQKLESTDHRLSTQFALHVDGDTLAVIVSNTDLPQDKVDLALAHGLAWAGDRDLVIVLPSSRVEPTRERAAFVEVPLKLWEFDGTGIRPVTPLTQGEVLERFAEPLRGTRAHDLRERAEWVSALLVWS